MAETTVVKPYPGEVSIERANDEQRLAEAMAAAENERARLLGGDIPSQEEYRERRATQQEDMYGVTSHAVKPGDGPDEATTEELQDRRAQKLEAQGVRMETAEPKSTAEIQQEIESERERMAEATEKANQPQGRGRKSSTTKAATTTVSSGSTSASKG